MVVGEGGGGGGGGEDGDNSSRAGAAARSQCCYGAIFTEDSQAYEEGSSEEASLGDNSGLKEDCR